MRSCDCSWVVTSASISDSIFIPVHSYAHGPFKLFGDVRKGAAPNVTEVLERSRGVETGQIMCTSIPPQIHRGFKDAQDESTANPRLMFLKREVEIYNIKSKVQRPRTNRWRVRFVPGKKKKKPPTSFISSGCCLP